MHLYDLVFIYIFVGFAEAQTVEHDAHSDHGFDSHQSSHAWTDKMCAFNAAYISFNKMV